MSSSLQSLPQVWHQCAGLFPKNAMVTFWWCSGEVDWHTFYNIGVSHINDHACITMTELVVTCFDIGNSRCIEACISHRVIKVCLLMIQQVFSSKQLMLLLLQLSERMEISQTEQAGANRALWRRRCWSFPTANSMDTTPTAYMHAPLSPLMG
jgi:hypothetical protein